MLESLNPQRQGYLQQVVLVFDLQMNLQSKVWGYQSELETHTVETHIYRLRKKISEKFKDNNFINSTKKGYII